jgi:hypothetical protein
MSAKILCRACQLPMTTIGASRLHATCDIDPDILATELFGIIEEAIAQQPRTLQTSIGPSEIGNPCDRRIGYKLAGTQPVNGVGAVNWKAFVGTAIHEILADIIGKDELRNLEADDFTATRWHVEERVKPGMSINGVDVEGSCDLFDAATGTVWDWKTTTRNKIREVSTAPTESATSTKSKPSCTGQAGRRKGSTCEPSASSSSPATRSSPTGTSGTHHTTRSGRQAPSNEYGTSPTRSPDWGRTSRYRSSTPHPHTADSAHTFSRTAPTIPDPARETSQTSRNNQHSHN